MVLIQIHGVKDQRDVCKRFCIEQLMKILKALLAFLFEGKIISFHAFLQYQYIFFQICAAAVILTIRVSLDLEVVVEMSQRINHLHYTYAVIGVCKV